MLQREEFLLFAAGFSLSLMLKQSITLFVEFKKQNILNTIMLVSWTLYILVQGSNAWNILYHKSVMDPRFLAVSTILYTITIISTLYISIIRVVALNCNGLKTMTRYVKVIMFPLLLILTFIRCLRTALLITQGSNIAVLETVKYQGDCIAFQDWWLIAWSISSSIEQRSHYRSIFAFVGDSLNPGSTTGSSVPKSLGRSNSRLSPTTDRESVSSSQTLAFSNGTTSLSMSPLRSSSSNSDFSNYARFERV